MSEFVVKHNGKTHNISRFLHFHPGGSNTLRTFKGCDISPQLENVHHSPAAYNLLEDYRVSDDKEKSQKYESLVNWEKAMFWQVGSLGSDYNKWILLPVDRKLRLFQTDFMERLTITPWYLVPLVWIPVSSYCIYLGYLNLIQFTPFNTSSTAFLVGTIFFFVLLGYFIWPLIEYSIHRWLFHMDPPADSPFLITLHFTIHGLHHKVPFDSRRLLFPPTATAIVVVVVYVLLRLLLPVSVTLLMIAGGILGYVSYDLMHFYLHYGSPSEGSYLYFMKRYHNQHHFTYHQSGWYTYLFIFLLIVAVYQSFFIFYRIRNQYTFSFFGTIP